MLGHFGKWWEGVGGQGGACNFYEGWICLWYSAGGEGGEDSWMRATREGLGAASYLVIGKWVCREGIMGVLLGWRV